MIEKNSSPHKEVKKIIGKVKTPERELSKGIIVSDVKKKVVIGLLLYMAIFMFSSQITIFVWYEMCSKFDKIF